MSLISLSAVARVESGAGFPLDFQGSKNDQFPFLKVSDMNLSGNERQIHSWNNTVSNEVRERLRAKAFPKGTLIFPKIGAAIATNKKRQLTRSSCIDNNVMAIVPDEKKITPDFLYFAFLAKNISDFASASNPPSIRKPDVEQWKLHVPSLTDQEKIVDVLSRAEGIVRLRREAQKKAAELIQAIFMEMFGSQTGPVVKLGEYLSIASSVRTPDITNEGELPCIGADSIEGDTGKILSWPTVNQIMPRSGKYFFNEGDILYSKIRPALCKATIAPTAGYCSADMYPLSQDHRATKEFVLSLLLSKDFTDYSVNESVRAQMPKINRETLFSYMHPLPPIEKQKTFSYCFKSVKSIEAQQTESLVKAECAFNALLGQMFAG